MSPGKYIREELKRRGWGQADLALIMGRPTQRINELVLGKAGVSPEVAVELAAALGGTAEEWLQREAAYRLSQANADPENVRRRARLYDLVPVKDMEKRGWLRRAETVEELESELCRFFGVASLEREPEINAMARKSSAEEALTPAQRAWCFRAKQLATGLQAKPYNPTGLDAGVAKLRELAAYPEEVRRVPRILANIGIRFVVIEPLPKSRIDGVAFWLDQQSPVIALSVRFDRIDSFWHTLGHEMSHVRHRDTPLVDADIVGENRPAPAEQSATELRADREAAATWIDPEELASFIVRVAPLYSKARINQFANRMRIHPGIIVGQLQHRGEMSYGSNREMLVKVREKVTQEALTDGWNHTVEEHHEKQRKADPERIPPTGR